MKILFDFIDKVFPNRRWFRRITSCFSLVCQRVNNGFLLIFVIKIRNISRRKKIVEIDEVLLIINLSVGKKKGNAFTYE
jgi:hypothetical protein